MSEDIKSPEEPAVDTEEAKPKRARKTAEPKPEPEPENSVSAEEPEAALRLTVSGERTDNVFIDKIVPHNKAARKSLSVRHFQFRLAELGYHEALVDPEGYYGDHVIAAVAAFQHDRGFISTGQPDPETVSRVFQNDSNVNLHL